jgi:uncharacterized membrane protein YraQ (UPF0718 family)/copper chaperone CopZ
MEYVLNIAQNFWMVLSMMAPYLLLGFFMAGLLSVLVSAELVERHLGGRGVWPVIKAALLGMPIPLCSCAVIPVSASLRRHGASKGSTVSFLISTPETGVDGIAATWGVLGGAYAVFRVVVALVSGVIGGLAVEFLDHPDAAAKNGAGPAAPACTDSCCADHAGGGRHGKLRRMFEYGFVDLPQDIGKSLLLGLLIAALITTFVPEHYLHGTVLGHGILAMLTAALLAGPVYVCATASVPMAAAMIVAGFSPGAALVFLMVGPATNATTIAMVWKVMGRRTAAIYLLSVLGCAIAAGLTMDYVYQTLDLTLPAMAGHHEHEGVNVLQSIAAVALLGIIGNALWRRGKAKAATPAEILMKTETLKITGMTCNHCVSTVRRTLLEIPGVQAVDVDLAGGKAVVSGDGLDPARLRRAVQSLGYGLKD